MIPEKWNENSYKTFVDYLLSLGDEKYKAFHSSLVLNSKYDIIGIRLPIMKSLAKEIGKGDIEGFLACACETYYEEVMLQGLVIAQIKEEKLFYKYFKSHINKIDNWALCDTFCSAIKIVRKYEDKYFNKAVELSKSEDEFISRTGLVIILAHFVNENNLDMIFDTLNEIKSEKFYINMAEAWLVCELFIKHRDEALEFIKNNNLNKFTQNKAISKIRDSYRVTDEDKAMLAKLRK